MMLGTLVCPSRRSRLSRPLKIFVVSTCKTGKVCYINSVFKKEDKHQE